MNRITFTCFHDESNRFIIRATKGEYYLQKAIVDPEDKEEIKQTKTDLKYAVGKLIK